MCCYNIDGADDGVVTHGPLIEAKGCVRTEPFSLPDGFRWDNLELSSQGAVSSSCRFTETAISKSGGEIVEKTEQSRLRQTEQGFSVSAEGALHSAEWELPGWGRQHRQVRLLSRVPAMVSFKRVHLLHRDFECKWVSLFEPCYLFCWVYDRTKVFLKNMNHSLWQTADECRSNQSGYQQGGYTRTNMQTLSELSFLTSLHSTHDQSVYLMPPPAKSKFAAFLNTDTSQGSHWICREPSASFLSRKWEMPISFLYLPRHVHV